MIDDAAMAASAGKDANDLDGLYPSIMESVNSRAKNSIFSRRLLTNYIKVCKEKSANPWDSALLLRIFDMDCSATLGDLAIYDAPQKLITGAGKLNMTIEQARFIIKNYKNDSDCDKVYLLAVYTSVISNTSGLSIEESYEKASRIVSRGVLYGNWRVILKMIGADSTQWFNKAITMLSRFAPYDVPLLIDAGSLSRISYAEHNITIDKNDWDKCTEYMLNDCVPYYSDNNSGQRLTFIPIIVRMNIMMMTLHPENYDMDPMILTRFAFLMNEFMNVFTSRNINLNRVLNYIDVSKNELKKTIYSINEHRIPLNILAEDLMFMDSDERYISISAINEQVASIDLVHGYWCPWSKNLSLYD